LNKPFPGNILRKLTTQQDIESVAAQLAELTQSVSDMASQLTALRAGAEKQQERADTQQERIDLAAKELTEVSDRLQAAANALRQSV
jgi:peptidoglycan hydrolase CwlO-like protein